MQFSWLKAFQAEEAKTFFKILAISIATERDVIKMCFKHYYFLISLLSSLHSFIFFKCSLLKFHVSLCLHHTDSAGKLLQERYCLRLGVSVWAGLC